MQTYSVRGRRSTCHLIPYIGNKSGFAHIFDDLIPDQFGYKPVVDAFGGSGAFAIYWCVRFGSEHVTYNDNNPVVVNMMRHVRDDIEGLIGQYHIHREKSSPEYYLQIRKESIQEGLKDAGRFMYLAKNAFSGKIRFNSENKFNSPMRKGVKCPKINRDKVRSISRAIRHMKITCESFDYYKRTRESFLYLDPPYMFNPNSHYNGVPEAKDFARFVHTVTPHNDIMISEQNNPEDIGIPESYRVYRINLRRSLQYITQQDSREIIAINYDPDTYRPAAGPMDSYVDQPRTTASSDSAKQI